MRLRALSIGLMCIAASPLSAATYCIATASGLTSAMSSANSGDEGTVQDIRLRPGTYNLPGGLDFDPAGDKDNKDFSLTGGWNSNCTSRTINASATVLNAENGANDGAFGFFGNHERLVVEGIRFINFSNWGMNDIVCGVGDICPDTTTMRVRYNEFRNGRVVAIVAQDAQQYTASNNLFADLAPTSDQAVALYYYNNESNPVMAFNTFAGIECDSTADVALALLTERSGATVHHNVFESTGCGADLEISTFGQTVALRNNLYQTRAGLTPSTSSGNIISSDPGFVNAGSGDYHLRETGTASAAINSGMTQTLASSLGLSSSIPAQDLDGPAGARLVGSKYDLGAYESSINDASVLTVINENDSGAGSLRAAITSSNASAGLQTIEFNIAGGCNVSPHVILLQTPLPDITDSVVIDGYSEPESAPNTLSTGSDAVLCVVIAAQSGVLAQALQVPTSAAAATSLTLKGVGIAGSTGFNGNFTVALRLRGGSHHLIQGNAFAGIGPGSVGSLGTLGFGIQIRDTAQNATIGGADPEHRNSFGAMDSSAIVLNDATSGGHTIQNNYIGLSASGIAASPIGLNGIFASNSPDVRILDNVISAVGTSAAISITGATATGYEIARNKLGTSASSIPTAAFRNAVGISFTGGTGDHQVGGILNSTASNLITNSDGAGVHITPSAGSGITVRPNRIFANAVAGSGLGIDIGALGALPNDSGDGDGGPNNGQNHPVITNSLPNPDGTRQVTGTLNAQNGQYIVDIYRSPDCPGGRGNMLNLVGTQFVTNLVGVVGINIAVPGQGAPGLLTAVATRISNGDTSEVSECFLEPRATATTITNDAPDPSQFGQPYTVTVLVTSPNGTPTGTVEISDGTNECSGNLNGGGITSCQLPSTSVGNKTLTANYGGAALYAPSSDTAPHAVVPANTATTITSDAPDPSEVGTAYTVAVSVSSIAGTTPGGQVQVNDGAGATCNIGLANAMGSCQLTSTSVGQKTLTASYQGVVNFNASSDTEFHNVTTASTTTTITSDQPDPSVINQPYTVMVTVASALGSPPGAVAIGDGTTTCNAFLTNGSGQCVLMSATPGNKTLTASYPGGGQYAGSSDTESHQVTLPPTTTSITSDAPDPSTVGELYVVQVQVQSAAGTPAGTVTIFDGFGGGCDAVLTNGFGACQMSSSIGGQRTLTANYPGSAGFASSQDTEPHQVNPAASTVVITSDAPDPSVTGQPYTVMVQSGSPSGLIPTNTVTINDGSGAQCQASPNAQGVGSCQLTSTTPGAKTLTAQLGTSGSFIGSSDTEPHQVSDAPPIFANGFE